MYTLLKSEVGPFPELRVPSGVDLPAEDKKARRRLYPVTIVYSVQFLTFLARAIRLHHARSAFAFVILGMLSWIPLEYWAHRYVLHGVFPKRGGFFKQALHYLFDASHADHHARPWDGMYINGHIDTLWLALVVVPFSLLFPVHTAPIFVATVLLCYATEEWVHHATHFWNFNCSYFQQIRRRHLYHHSRHGVGTGYGVTSELWDVVVGTRIPAPARRRLQPKRSLRNPAAWSTPTPPENVSAQGV